MRAACGAAALLVGCLSGCGIGRQARATPTPIYAPKPVSTTFVHLSDSHRFEPSQLEGEPSQLIELVLVGDAQKHDFTSPDLNANIDVPPKQVEIIRIELPAKPGDYEFWSAQPGDKDAGMIGHFQVRPAAH